MKTKTCWLCDSITNGSDWCDKCDKINNEIENDKQDE